MIKNCIVLLLIFIFLPCTTNAANLYLKDGGYIECFFAKQQGGTVYVLINRDTEIELYRSEVAIKKTFKNKKTIGSYRRYKKSSSSSVSRVHPIPCEGSENISKVTSGGVPRT